MENIDLLKAKMRLLRSHPVLRPGRSLYSTARVVSRNEALKIIDEIERGVNGHPSKIKELFARILSLNIRFKGGFSPFNPHIGFYVWSVLDNGYLVVEALGRNVHETALSLALYLVKKVFKVVPVKEDYYYTLFSDGFKVGKVFIAKSGRKDVKCIISKVNKTKIVQHYMPQGLIVENKIYLPKDVKRIILPHLRRLEQEFSNLCLHDPKRFLELLRRSINEEN